MTERYAHVVARRDQVEEVAEDTNEVDRRQVALCLFHTHRFFRYVFKKLIYLFKIDNHVVSLYKQCMSSTWLATADLGGMIKFS